MAVRKLKNEGAKAETEQATSLIAVDQASALGNRESPAHALYDQIAVRLSDVEPYVGEKWSRRNRLVFIVGVASMLWVSIIAAIFL